MRGNRTTFSFSQNTVTTSANYKSTNEAHGWLWIRLQVEPGGQPS